MATFPTFHFPGAGIQSSGAFAPAQIDFSKIGQIADSYYDAQNNRMKRDAFQEQQAAARAERDRQNQVRQVFAQGLPRDAQGNIDYSAASERLLALDPNQGVDFLKMGSQEADRRHSREFDREKFNADQAYRQQQLGLQREQLAPSDVREYQFYAGEERAAGRDPMGFADWRRQPKAGTGKYGTTVQYTTEGRPWVVGTDGSTKFLDLGGATPLGPEGTAAAKAKGAATGKFVGQAQSELPGVIQNATQVLGMLGSLESDPYLDRMLGPIDSRTPDWSSEAGRVAGKMDQIQGSSFLTAFESLKGGGQITEVEGTKATQAISRLGQRNVKPEDYRAAIDDLRAIVRNGVIRARVDAGELPQSALGQLRNFEGELTAPGGGNASAQQAPVRISGDDEFDQLPSGTLYVGPDNKPRRKP